MLLQTVNEVMLICQGDPGKKYTAVLASNTHMPVCIAYTQLEIDDTVDLRATMTARIVIRADFVILVREEASGGALVPPTNKVQLEGH